MEYFKTIQPLKILKKSFLRKGMDFYEDMNLDFFDSMGEDIDIFNYACGASKLVLIPLDPSEKYVIKIPYTGYYYGSYNYEKTEKTGSFFHYNHRYDKYEAGEVKQLPWDYCATEVKRYRLAREKGFEKFFARTFFYTTINGYPIYLQEKCNVLSKNRKDHTFSKEERRRTSSIEMADIAINIDWLTAFRLQYGEQKLIEFSDFIKTLNWDDDLRDENVGYLNNKPVLIDYSGFMEE